MCHGCPRPCAGATCAVVVSVPVPVPGVPWLSLSLSTPICVQPPPMPWCPPGADTVPVPTRAVPGHPLRADTCGVGQQMCHLCADRPPMTQVPPECFSRVEGPPVSAATSAQVCPRSSPHVLTPLMCQCQPCADAKCVPRYVPAPPGLAQLSMAGPWPCSVLSLPPGPNTAFSSRTTPLFFTSPCLWPFHFCHMDTRRGIAQHGWNQGSP